MSALVESPFGKFEIHTIHVPPATVVGWSKKAATFDCVYERLACDANLPRILCGDFNSPKEELPDGRVLPFGSGRTRQREAELQVMKGLEPFDLTDVYRQLYGYEANERSWYWEGRGRAIGRRFDHVFASRSLNAVNCQYLHSFREARLSDHSAIEVVFASHGQ
jgi:exonuclease III